MSKNKEYTELLERKIQEINQKFEKKRTIKLLGWVSNVEELQAKSHICIGKGRSILSSAAMGKISFVISETGFLTMITPTTYETLSYYNFSGRGNLVDDTEIFISLVSNFNFDNYKEECESISKKIKNEYSIHNGKNKLKKTIESSLNGNESINFLSGIKKLILIYYYLFNSIFFKKNKTY